jgi:iron complex outermembrane recepter protein
MIRNFSFIPPLILWRFYYKKNVYILSLLLLFFTILSTQIYKFQEEFQIMEEYLSLRNIMVVSASRSVQHISDAPVSISVITREEIISSGFQDIPEILRKIPGVYVQAVKGGQYEVGIRGVFNVPISNGTFSSLSTNILVLIDGRSFLNDSFGGTDWEFLPVTINDIERIEVVRGGASALFGANALSGVINIITRNNENNTFKLNYSKAIKTPFI